MLLRRWQRCIWNAPCTFVRAATTGSRASRPPSSTSACAANTPKPTFSAGASSTVIYGGASHRRQAGGMPGTMAATDGCPGAFPVLDNFPDVLDFAKMEMDVMAHWDRVQAFETSLKQSEEKKPFNFYDGPPFATGLPHYGHLLAGTIKDIVCRYAHQTGHFVERRFGWDCHGLPVEFEIDKSLGIKSSHDVAQLGIANYNNECEKIVMRYSSEWEKTVRRMGRWIDFQNDYKTMRLPYMESVWWVFGELWRKNYVYRGYKVMPFSTGCTTPLSNFEANMDYRDVSDPSVTIAFQVLGEENVFFLVWTTTPWTLPSNLALCVHPEVDYVKVQEKKSGRHYILAEARLSEVFKSGKKDTEPLYTVEEKYKGTDLVGRKYAPLFPYFEEVYKDTAFRVLSDKYVTTDSGTGVVHQAPGFGEDDYRICIAHGVVTKDNTVCPVDENGCFTNAVKDFAGLYVKAADEKIMEKLKQAGHLFAKASIVHSYPYCWRSETPLLYKAVDSWFVNVEKFRDRLVEANNTTRWVPEFVKTRRFSNWLENAMDWNVSRNRYWGTPLPVWHSEDWEEVVCVSSVAELEELSGVKNITNIHRQFVDEITIPSKRPGVAPLKRVAEVFDCWFESGSMPYAQQHYPFENKDTFLESRFPADFVAEGLDQTRGWFYTLLVLGVALFDKAVFRNVVVNGLILAEDGKKMSKRLKNYPEPTQVIDQYGADALRMYMINSPVVRAEPLRFREVGVKEIVRDVLLPLFNAAKFFITNVNHCHKLGHTVSVSVVSTNMMDRWILASSQTLTQYVRKEMELYHLYNVVPGVLRFIVDLSNWYVRMNRRRLKCVDNAEDGTQALSTLLQVLFIVSRIVAPIAPFVSEMLYQRIKPLLPLDSQVDSVHHLMVPDVDESKFDNVLELAMKRMMTVVDLVRVERDRMGRPMKRPVRQIIVVHPDKQYRDDIERMASYIKEEVNSFDVKIDTGDEYVVTKLDANMGSLGKRLKKEAPEIRKALQAMDAAAVATFLKAKSAVICGQEITMEDVKVLRTFKEGITGFSSNTDNDVVVLVDAQEDQGLIDSWRAREFVNRIQQLRKKAGMEIGDRVDVYFTADDEELVASILNCKDQVSLTVKGLWTTMDKMPTDATKRAEEENEIGGVALKLVFTYPSGQ